MSDPKALLFAVLDLEASPSEIRQFIEATESSPELLESYQRQCLIRDTVFCSKTAFLQASPDFSDPAVELRSSIWAEIDNSASTIDSALERVNNSLEEQSDFVRQPHVPTSLVAPMISGEEKREGENKAKLKILPKSANASWFGFKTPKTLAVAASVCIAVTSVWLLNSQYNNGFSGAPDHQFVSSLNDNVISSSEGNALEKSIVENNLASIAAQPAVNFGTVQQSSPEQSELAALRGFASGAGGGSASVAQSSDEAATIQVSASDRVAIDLNNLNLFDTPVVFKSQPSTPSLATVEVRSSDLSVDNLFGNGGVGNELLSRAFRELLFSSQSTVVRVQRSQERPQVVNVRDLAVHERNQLNHYYRIHTGNTALFQPMWGGQLARIVDLPVSMPAVSLPSVNAESHTVSE